MAVSVEFNRPMLDWLTLTSYDDKLARRGTAVLAGMPEPFARKIICYDGLASDSEEGGCFVGQGEQNGRYHCMLQLSGGLSDRIGPQLIGGHEVGDGIGNISRIDLQITIAEKIDLDALANELVGKIRSQVTIYRTLQGGQVGDTLYIGSPKSDKRVRLYHKAGGTRFEVQYRRDYASSVAGGIRDTGRYTVAQQVASYLLNDVGWIDSCLSCDGENLGVFVDCLWDWCEGTIAPESNTRASGNTELWLRKSVFPCLVKECNRNPRLKRELLAKLHNCSPNTGEIIE